MRVLQILPELRVGGVETGTVDLARYLVEHGHQALVISNGGELVVDLEEAGARHIELPAHRKNILTAIWCTHRLIKILQQEKVDIVHARSRVPGWIAFFACQKIKTPFVTTCHGYYSKHFFSRVMAWGKLIIVPSKVIGRHMIEDFHVAAENIRCIPRSVDLRKFNIPRSESFSKSEYTISIIGRITPLKGHEYFLRAMARVVRTLPYVKIWIIGDAPEEKISYREGLKVLVRRLGLADKVEFLGSRKDIPELLAETDVLVFSSVVPESFGRVIVEAQAAGVPVVAARVGGVVEIIEDEQTGILVEPKHPEKMAEAVVRVLEDKVLARRLVENAKEKILSHYTLDHMASQTLEVYGEVLKHIKILVIKLSALGDVILIMPSLKALRERFPLAKISCLVKKDFREILQRCPYLDEVIVYDPVHKHKGFWGFGKIIKKLRRYRFDKVIDFQNNRKSHLLAFLSLCHERYGYKNTKWGALLSNSVSDDHAPIPAVAHQFRVLNLLGITTNGQEHLELWPSKEDEKYIQQLFESQWIAKNTQLVGINLAASSRWESKRWPLDYVAELCDILAAQNIRVVLTGVEKDKILARELLKKTKAKPADLIGKTNVLQLAALIRKCHVYVTPDSASMHIAAAMETPFVAFFGPTDPLRHLPPSKKSRILYRKLDCMHCYQSRCPLHTHDCMTQITPQEVAQAVRQLMDNS
ncbi:MAG: lipopolysaccharide heptosyltransferase II [Candidatus Aceula meridiana]|nr:lipopolysaccharide heptosyltransferase II [Candidatus Aceula meridiana]